MQTVEIDGDTDLSQYVGRAMAYQTWEGETLIGNVERFEGMRPIIRFADGRWAYGPTPQIDNGNVELTFS